jgi:hypothetical protein
MSCLAAFCGRVTPSFKSRIEKSNQHNKMFRRCRIPNRFGSHIYIYIYIYYQDDKNHL